MPGPTRKPKEIAELEGNPGKRPYKDIPEPRRGAPKPPAWMTGEALAEWGRIVPELTAINLLSVVDRAALVAYCESWSTFVSATEDIETRGTIVEGRDGNMVRNPAVQMQRDALDQIKKWVAEFGLTPSARAKMQLPSDHGADGEDAAVADLFAI